MLEIFKIMFIRNFQIIFMFTLQVKYEYKHICTCIPHKAHLQSSGWLMLPFHIFIFNIKFYFWILFNLVENNMNRRESWCDEFQSLTLNIYISQSSILMVVYLYIWGMRTWEKMKMILYVNWYGAWKECSILIFSLYLCM